MYNANPYAYVFTRYPHQIDIMLWIDIFHHYQEG